MKLKNRISTLRMIVSAAALLPCIVTAAEEAKKTIRPPLPAATMHKPAQLSLPAPANTATPSTQAGQGVSVPAPVSAVPPRMGSAGRMDALRQVPAINEMNDLRQGVQRMDPMAGGGRSGTGVSGVARPGTSGLSGVSASDQDGGAHTGGASRGAHTGSSAPYLPGFEPRGSHTGESVGTSRDAGAGASSGGAPHDPFVRDSSGQPVSHPAAPAGRADDAKKNENRGGSFASNHGNNTNAPRSNTNSDRPKEQKAEPVKTEKEKTDKPAKEPEGKEPKEKVEKEKSSTLPREDGVGGGAPRAIGAQGSGPGSRGQGEGGGANGPRVRVGGSETNPSSEVVRGGFAPRDRDQFGTGPGMRPGQNTQGVYGPGSEP